MVHDSTKQEQQKMHCNALGIKSPTSTKIPQLMMQPSALFLRSIAGAEIEDASASTAQHHLSLIAHHKESDSIQW